MLIRRLTLILLAVAGFSGRTDPWKEKAALFQAMTVAVSNNTYTGIHSILVFHQGSLDYEHYFNGYAMDSLQDTRSCFKSVVSLLVGIAIDQGFIKNIHQSVYDFFPEYASLVTADPRRQRMTIANLLQMESGFDCEEFNGTHDCETGMESSADWVRYSLSLPLKDFPGRAWAYTTCDAVILGGILSRATGMSVPEFARKYLFDPLGIIRYRWTFDSTGNAMTGGSFFARPRDLLKIGRMVMEGGMWENHRIVSAAYMHACTEGTLRLPGVSFAAGARMPSPHPTYYGNYWYNEVVACKDYKVNVRFASGNGGQYIMVVPELNLVAVFTQGNYNSWKEKRAFDMLVKYILPPLMSR
jgi:CubicO group peptidase (beta-lactamase class C family)